MILQRQAIGQKITTRINQTETVKRYKGRCKGIRENDTTKRTKEREGNERGVTRVQLRTQLCHIEQKQRNKKIKETDVTKAGMTNQSEKRAKTKNSSEQVLRQYCHT